MADQRVDDMLQAIKALKEHPADGARVNLAHDLLAPPILVAPLFHHVLLGVAFVSNCTTAYLLAQVDEAFLHVPREQGVAVPRFGGSLSEIQEAFVEWVVDRTSPEILTRLEHASLKERNERHRRLALLRGHLTAMRWASDDADHLAEVEAQVSSLIARESRIWL
ncbi:hypothetical protein [Caulobacter sp. BP25]|uniref:hypothetical protein n=1 Tax=Caulobacter sp. BP25 TaxID=2048900 RepID=UPI000C12A3B6|nr:hypothetical protein [Caulobacter sp. BP25]PHY18823.1 hypothetical protein CSW59_10260 [Caulobacter sp. BP25]